MRIAIVGCGEVGSTYARALLAAGDHDVVIDDPRPEVAAWAAEHDLTLHRTAGPWLADVDAAWVCVAGDLAHRVITQMHEYLARGVTIIDLTTASPEDKARSAVLLGDRGVYIDAVIMGAIAMNGVATPLLGAGPHAEGAMSVLADLGAPVRTLPDAAPGDAAALKLLRSVLTKGLEALGVECLVAAERMGVRDQLPAVLADIDAGGLTPFVDAVVRTHPLHAKRRQHEVHRAGLQLAGHGGNPSLLAATEERFAATVAAAHAAPPPPDVADHVDDAVRWLLTTTPTP